MPTEQTESQSRHTNPLNRRSGGECTVIRPISAKDLPVLKAWDEDPDIVALMGRKYDDLDVEEWFQSVCGARNCRALAIETKDGRLIGELELAQLNWRNGTAELRICIGEKDCWGMGYGTDALQTTLSLAFHRFGLRMVYLRVFATNVRAVRLYKRVGFTVEGVLQPSQRRGDPAAVLLMRVTRERWTRYSAGTA